MHQIVARDHKTLVPLEEKFEVKDLDDSEIQEVIVNNLKSYSNEEENNGMSYHLKIKKFTVKNFLLQFVLSQIKQRGEEYLGTFEKNGLLQDLIDSLFKVANKPQKPQQQLPIDQLNILGYQIRKKALESSEALDETKGLTVYIRGNKYIAFKGLQEGTQDVVSFPIAGSINIQANYISRVLRGSYSKDISQFGSLSTLEASIIETNLFNSDPEKAFSIILNSKITVVSEEINMLDLYRQMFKISSHFPQQFDGLEEKIVVQLEYSDYKQVMDSSLIQFAKRPKIGQSGSRNQQVCKLLQTVGGCSEELLEYLSDSKLEDMVEIQRLLIKGLNSKNLGELVQKQKEILAQNIGQQNGDSNVQETLTLEEFKNSEQQIDTMTSRPQKNWINQEEKVFDIRKNKYAWQRVEGIIQKSILPESDAERVARNNENENYEEAINKILNRCEGELILKEYENVLVTFNGLLDREILLYIFSFGDLEKLIPTLIMNKEGKANFANFLKVTYNLGYSSDNKQSQDIAKIGKEILQKICKLIGQERNDQNYNDLASFLKDFYIQDILKGGLKASQTFQVSKNGDPLVYSLSYQDETQAIQYSTPQMFHHMTNLLITNCPKFFIKVLNNHAHLMTDIISLSNLYAIYTSLYQTSTSHNAIITALHLIGFATQNFTSLNLKPLELLINNHLASYLAQNLKIGKKLEKVNQLQKMILEVYTLLGDLRKKIADRKSKTEQVQNEIEMTQLLQNIRRTLTVIDESSRDSFEYRKYREFLKSCDQATKDSVIKTCSTAHPMFNQPFVGYKKVEGCSALKIVVKAKSQLPIYDEFAITTDQEGKNVIKVISTQDLVEDLTLNLYRNDFYIHYPYNQQSKLIAFGSQVKGRLGNGKTEGLVSGTLVSSPFAQNKIKGFWSHKCFTLVQTEDDKLFFAGTLKGCETQKTFIELKLADLNDPKIEHVSVGTHSIIVKTDTKFLAMGQSAGGHIKGDDGALKTLTGMDAKMDVLNSQKIIQIVSGTDFTLFLSEKGKLYCRGDIFLKSIRMEGQKSVRRIPIDEKYQIKRVFTSQGAAPKYGVVILEVIDTEDKVKKYLSAGKNSFGLLGQGGDVKVSEEFKPMSMQFRILSFTQIQLYKKSAMAISKDGQLYVWGQNTHGLLGMPNSDEIIFAPTQNMFFKSYIVQNIQVGQIHSLVQATKKNKTMMFSIGRPSIIDQFQHLGISEQTLQKNLQQNIWELATYSDQDVERFAIGKTASFVILNPKKQSTANQHKISETHYEEGVLHFYFDEDGKLNMLPPSKYEELKDTLPDLCFAIKYPIKNLQSRKFPIDLNVLSNYIDRGQDFPYHPGVICSTFKEEIIGPRYYTKCQIGDDVELQNLCEQAFFTPKECDMHPLVFIRMAKPIDNTIDFPIFNMKDFFDTNFAQLVQTEKEIKEETYHGLEIIVRPNLKNEINREIIGLNQNGYESIQKLWKKIDKPTIDLFKEYVGSQLITDDSLNGIKDQLVSHRDKYTKLTDDQKTEDKISEIINTKFRALLDLTPEHYSLICGIMERTNKHYQKFMRISQKLREAPELIEKFGWSRHQEFVLSDLMVHVKRKIINEKIKKLKQSDEASVTIRRRKAFYFVQSDEVDHEGQYTIFGQVYQKLKADNFAAFKKNNVDTKAFSVTFSGEGSQDAGGPFRDCISNMCKELQTKSLPLLIKTANNKNNHGQLRECWIPNPSSKSPSHFKLFQFFGAMVGWALRSTSALELDLPPLFWKKILGSQCTEYELKQIDTFSWQVIEDLRSHKKSLKPEDFDAAVDQQFVTLLSDGSEVELCFRGKEKNVTWDNVDEFIDLVIKTRLNEFDEQMHHIKEGIRLILPDDILVFMTWQELDIRATGAKTCDPSTLKKITGYDGFKEDSETVLWFWEIFEEMTPEQRSLYLKFVWGRSRLPMNLDSISRKHGLEYYKSRKKDSLPISHTCFFRIDFPDYSSKEILKQRLLYAIQFCGDIDADRDRHSISDE